MARSFGIVDYKVRESEFFLEELRRYGNDLRFDAVQFCASAFASATRSVTFAMQASLKGNPAFDEWYRSKQAQLRGDSLARFFHDFRTVTNHIGDTVVGKGAHGADGTYYFFTPTPDLPHVPEQDVVSACEAYFTTILKVVYDCYVEFGSVIDGQQYFTENNFRQRGKTIEDAEQELGFPRGYTDIGDPGSEPYRWQVLRDQADGCEIESQFFDWLKLSVPREPRLPSYESPEPWED